MKRRVWFERRFDLGLPPQALPDILERLRGTPARLEERLGGVDAPRLTRRIGDRWSIKENVGHLLELEPLWAGRVEDLVGGADELRPADLTNRGTHEAGFNGYPLAGILEGFREARAALVGRIASLDETERKRAAPHPRLRQPMTVTDLAFFVAEHDDHHLAAITELLDTPS